MDCENLEVGGGVFFPLSGSQVLAWCLAQSQPLVLVAQMAFRSHWRHCL